MPDASSPHTPEALRALDLAALLGGPVADARRTVEAAGGHLRAVPVGGAMTADYRPARVTVLVEADLVVEVLGIA